MSEAARAAVLGEYCKELKMPAVRREYPALARQARNDGCDYEDFLKDLLEAEITSRRDHAATSRLREARFPDVKTLDQLDWKTLKGIPKPKIAELAACDFIGKGEDIVIAGPIGTGKSHVAIAIGVEAARRDRRRRGRGA